MADTLLDDGGGFYHGLPDLAAIFCFDDLDLGFVYGQGVGMDRCLRNQTVGQRQSENTANEARTSEEKEIPMEARWFLKRILSCLRRERTHIMIIVKQQHHQKPKRHRNKNPLDVQVPKVNDPVPVLGRLERANDWYAEDVGARKTAGEPVEADPEEGRKGEGVVCENAADPRFPEGAAAELFESVHGAEVQDSDDDGEVAACETGGFEEVDEFFYTLDYVVVSLDEIKLSG
jgi:hypothetical protein